MMMFSLKKNTSKKDLNTDQRKKYYKRGSLTSPAFKTIGNLIASVSRLFARNFIVAFAWATGFVFLVTVFVYLASGSTVIYRGSVFKTRPLWSIVNKNVEKSSKGFMTKKITGGAVDKTADNINGWFVRPVSDALPFKQGKVDQIALFRISGTIMPECLSARVVCPQSVQDFVDYISSSKQIKGVVILLNSPGGEVYSSEAIYQSLKKLSTKKPVYVYIESEDASGAYYISLAANKIYASPVSIIGSIGVYMEVFNYEGLLQKLGIKHKYIVSSNAKYKLVNRWLFDESVEGKQVQQAFQDVIDSAEEVFWDRVKTDRPQAKLRTLHGLMFSASKARELGLVDGVLNQPIDAVVSMLNEDNLQSKKYIVVEYKLEGMGSYATISGAFKAISKMFSETTNYYLMWK